MRNSRFTDEQIIGVLREVDAGAKLKTRCRRLGITETTCYRWESKLGDMQVPEARRLRALEGENRRLKRLVADQALNIQVLKDVAGQTGDRRAAAECGHLGASVRRRQ
jgi:putative transposase